MSIDKQIAYLKKRFKTNNPFEIANSLNINIIFEDLGSTKGYYNKILRMKQIHINQNLSEHLKIFTCAHELGHAILHPNANTPFLRSNTYLSVDKFEIEANTFAVELLISDETILEYCHLSIGQMARVFGYHEELIQMRMKSYLTLK